MPRPYVSFTIEQLEAEYEKHRDSAAALKRLLHELEFRRMPRAHALRTAVSARIAERPAIPREAAGARATPRPADPPAPTVDGKNGDDPPPGSENDAPNGRPGTEAEPPLRPIDQNILRLVPPQPPAPPIAFLAPSEGDGKHEVAILGAWHALEVLSPQTYPRPEALAEGDRSRIAQLDEASMPWEGGGEKSRPRYRLYYQIVLGSLDMVGAVSRLMAVFPDSREERPGASGRCVIASVVVDQRGKLAGAGCCAVSSFAWALPRVLENGLRELEGWPSVETQLTEELRRRLHRVDADGVELPVTGASLREASEWLVGALSLPPDLVRGLEFAVRVYHYFQEPDPPDPLLLNSFFLQDLALSRRAAERGHTPELLARYLGSSRPSFVHDLLRDTSALAGALRPSRIPPARWPGPGRHSLVVLQQAAVNLATSELRNGGLLAVNGPPGTGKTTLLRDLVAATVTARAEAMAAFDDPAEAFSSSGMRLRSGSAWTHLYTLHPSLKGHEIVVASSNNKAVENVSAELPSLENVAEEFRSYRYFRCVSDGVHDVPTWGLAGAVLGNRKNRGQFTGRFWWDEDTGMRAYLAATAGMKPTVSVVDARGKTVRRPPKVAHEDDAPGSAAEAKRRWRQARKHFRLVLARSRDVLASLDALDRLGRWIDEQVRAADESDQRAAEARSALDRAARDERKASRDLEDFRGEFEPAQAAVVISWEEERAARLAENTMRQAVIRGEISKLRERLARLDAEKPGRVRSVVSAGGRQWTAERRTIESDLRAAESALDGLKREASRIHEEKGPRDTPAAAEMRARLLTLEREHRTRRDALDRCRRGLADEEQRRATLRAPLERANAELERLRAAVGEHFVDERFLARKPEDLQPSVAWLADAAQWLRDEVFVAAFQLHKAFIDAAATPLRHNLQAIVGGFGRNLPPEKQSVLGDLWSSLFLVVPLISTTFASVDRMFGPLPDASIGWLLIDEGGQALPQAAVGALRRARRSVVVGDPLQIEPVVSLPENLTKRICMEFGVDPERFNAPRASVQTLADAASPYVGHIETMDGERTVGVPLLVHRRCSEPMFGISNQVAYGNAMVHAKPERPSVIRDVLGPSCWADVRSEGEDKWSPAEGRVACDLLARLARALPADAPPDLYFVTPFVVVADNLRRVVLASPLLAGRVEDPHAWVRERIGTVHTVQGREAEAVIFVLGAPNASQTGARAWAGARPNLLNVAVSRAKECLYVVGNRALWSQAGHFRVLASRLPTCT